VRHMCKHPQQARSTPTDL